MSLDLYSYGRPFRDPPGRALETMHLIYVCGRCGCSATASDAELIQTLGWRVLPGRCVTAEAGDAQRATCPRCARRYVDLV